MYCLMQFSHAPSLFTDDYANRVQYTGVGSPDLHVANVWLPPSKTHEFNVLDIQESMEMTE